MLPSYIRQGRAAVNSIDAPENLFTNVKTYGAVGDGVTDDTVAIAAAWADHTSGILYFPRGTYIDTGTHILKDNMSIVGENKGAVIIDYRGDGYWLDTLDGTSPIDYFTWRDMSVECRAGSIGPLRVGRTSTDYADGLFSLFWKLSNIYAHGPGAAQVGTIGLSLTQLINHTVENINIVDFETSVIIDRCGNGTWTRPRFHAFKFGPRITNKGGTGTASNGSSQDVFINPEFLGPTVGFGGVPGTDYGYTVEIDTQMITFINALYEVSGAGATQGLIHLSNASGSATAGFMDINGAMSGTIAMMDNTIVIDNGIAYPSFFGTRTPIPGFPPVVLGIPYVSAWGSKARFINCSAELNRLVETADPTSQKAYILGVMDNNTQKYGADVHDFNGVMRVTAPAGYTIVPPTRGGSGVEVYYDPNTDTGNIKGYDRTGLALIDLLYSAINHKFEGAIVFNQAAATFADEDATPLVTGKYRFNASNTVATNITGFDGGSNGQEILVLFTNANTTLIHGASFRLSGGVNFSVPDQTVMRFWTSTGTVWYELSRSTDWS
jgi:hypothetical protein